MSSEPRGGRYFRALRQAEYPLYWPETIRALLVHSVEWTEPMQRAFDDEVPKDKLRRRLQRYGYGVPSLDRARYSARNSLTLIAQQALRPFE